MYSHNMMLLFLAFDIQQFFLTENRDWAHKLWNIANIGVVCIVIREK